MTKRVSMTFLQVIIVLMGIGVLTFLLRAPWFEGVNAHAVSLFDIYFDDPFLWYAYAASTPFFVALFEAFVWLQCVKRHNAFSPRSAQALRTISACGLALACFVAGGAAFAVALNDGTDDYAGFVALCAVITLISVVVAAAATVFERRLTPSPLSAAAGAPSSSSPPLRARRS